ncbi:MAG: hypothetical protein ABW201_20280 [Candidatus Thiodiazotropha sp.]
MMPVLIIKEGIQAHAYISNDTITRDQVDTANAATGGHLTYLEKNGQPFLLNPHLSDFADQDGMVRLIMEGVEASDESCTDNPETCYLSLQVVWGGGASSSERRLEAKVYLDLQDVREYYGTWTVGTAEQAVANNDIGCFEIVEGVPGYPAAEPANTVSQVHSDDPLWIYENVAEEDQKTANKAVLVHGWRMRDSEKAHFADTTFKRLYWLGYQGEFAAFTWPTGWFYKPAHCYGLGPASLALAHPQNYDQSEVVARLTGPLFGGWVPSQRTNSNTQLHVLAHSMGNVVVSEALRNGAGLLMDNYVATQAAEVGGSYDASLETMQHELVVDGIPQHDTVLSADGAWRRYNTENVLSDYGMPPDIYRYTNMIVQESGQSVIRHGETTSEQLAQEFGSNPDVAPYHAGITGSVGRLVNFVNTGDAALNTWEFNQLTKPDFLHPNGEPEWRYSNEQLCREDPLVGDLLWYYPDNSFCEGPSVTRVTSRFYRDDEEIAWNSQSPDGFHAYAQIMGHIIPARTVSLGRVEDTLTEAPIRVPNEGFTTSNQGHSAEFHGHLADPDIPRTNYWLDVMEDGFEMLNRPDGTNDYSGLRPRNR